MDTDPPQTPDRDLPGQPHDQADLDIVVEPDPESQRANEPEASDAPADDPSVGNTLIRPENS